MKRGKKQRNTPKESNRNNQLIEPRLVRDLKRCLKGKGAGRRKGRRIKEEHKREGTKRGGKIERRRSKKTKR